MRRGVLDSSYYLNPKMIAVGRDARDLHLGAIQYAVRLETDGFIPDEAVPTLDPLLGPKKSQLAVKSLQNSDLLTRCNGGYMIRDFFDFQKSREEAEEGRKRVRERVRSHRQRSGNAVTNPVTPTPRTRTSSGHVTQVVTPQSAADLDQNQGLGLGLDAAHARTREAAQPDEEPTPGRSGDPAAAEPIGETELRTLVAALPGAARNTLDTVEPLARSVPRQTFLDTLQTVQTRQARNPIGLLVRLLEAAIADTHRAHLEAQLAADVREPEPVERLPPDQALELGVRRLAENGHDWPAVADFVRNAYSDDDLDKARLIYDDALDPEPNAA